MAKPGFNDVATKVYNGIATVMIALGFLSAYRGSHAANLSAFDTGQVIGEVGVTMLMMLGVAWLVTRKSTPQRQARWRVLVGILFWLVVGHKLQAVWIAHDASAQPAAQAAPARQGQ